MTEVDRQLLVDLEHGRVTFDELYKQFSIDLQTDYEYVHREMKAAIDSGDLDRIQMTTPLIWISGDFPNFIDLLNELLVDPNHRRHQQIAKTLQDHVPSPMTVPFVRKALETNFDYLDYTCSDANVIAKWFSWLLYAIGTDEAIDLMKEYSRLNRRRNSKCNALQTGENV